MKRFVILLILIFLVGCQSKEITKIEDGSQDSQANETFEDEETKDEQSQEQNSEDTNILVEEEVTKNDVTDFSDPIAYYQYLDEQNHIFVWEDGVSTMITKELTYSVKSPALSPDGKKIAFSSGSKGHSHDGQNIYIMDVDGSNLIQLTNTSAYCSHPTWSNNQDRIAFVSEMDGNREIYLINTDGSNIKRLTNHDAEDMRPDFSSDDSHIVFSSYRDNNWEIYEIEISTLSLVRITETSKWELFPMYSTDDSELAYAATSAGTYNTEIYKYNLITKEEVKLTQAANVSENPVWTLSGDIVFQSNRENTFELYIMDSNGDNQVKLFDSDIDCFWPAVQ